MSGKTPYERWLAKEEPVGAEETRLFAQWTACERKAAVTA